MENLTPLQQRAHQLREDLKTAEDEKQQKQLLMLEAEARELMNEFSTSFSIMLSISA